MSVLSHDQILHEQVPDRTTETLLLDAVTAAVAEIAGPLTTPLVRVAAAGGKLLRPMLTLAVAGVGGRQADEPDVIGLAAAAELLHCATLVHDDLIDRATVRRGVGTVNAREGTPAAIVGGDLLIAAAGVTAARVNPAAALIISETLGELCRGEARQESMRYRPNCSTDAILEVAGAKTGALLRAACLLGAHSFAASPALRSAVAAFGCHFGLALQLVDDLLDIVSTEELAGKAVGVDFAAGNVTLPAALALPTEPRLRELLRPNLDQASRRDAQRLLQRADGALLSTVQAACEQARMAADSLLAAAGGNPAAVSLAGWPAQYLSQQLDRKIGARHRWLVPSVLDS